MTIDLKSTSKGPEMTNFMIKGCVAEGIRDVLQAKLSIQ